jgi:hypothetical protein
MKQEAPSGYAVVSDTLVPAAGHFAHELRHDDLLRIVNLEGEQVADLVLFNLKRLPDDVKIRQTRALAEAAGWLQKNPAKADKDYRELTQLEAGIIEKVLSGTTNPIDIHPLTAEDVGALHKDLEFV